MTACNVVAAVVIAVSGQLVLLRDFGFKAELECLESHGAKYLCDDYLPWKVQQIISPQLQHSNA
jgi:DNA topoisomerase VI subunit A